MSLIIRQELEAIMLLDDRLLKKKFVGELYNWMDYLRTTITQEEAPPKHEWLLKKSPW